MAPHISTIARDEPEYNDLVRRSGATLYHSPFWLSVLAETLGVEPRVLGAWEETTLRAALPFALSAAGPLGPCINSLPFFGSLGGVVTDQVGTRKTMLQKALLREMISLAEAIRAVSLNVILGPSEPSEEVYRDCIRPDYEDERITYILSLPPPTSDLDAALQGCFEGRTRTSLRKAMKQGFVVHRVGEDGDFDAFYRLHCSNMEKAGGLSKPASFMRALAKRKKEDRIELWAASKDGLLVAGALFFRHDHTVEYYMSGLEERCRHEQPLSLVLFEAMKSFARKGVKVFNFGGTWPNQEGLQRFKSAWGARAVPYRYFIRCGESFPGPGAVTREELSQGYPHFYVLPFAMLGSRDPDRGKDNAHAR
jgi:hypothetical protein